MRLLLAFISFAALTTGHAAPISGQVSDIQAVLTSAALAERNHWPKDRSIVISVDENVGVEKAVAARLNAELGSLRANLRCEGEPRRCTLPSERLFVVLRGPTISGNSATVYIETWRAGRRYPNFENVRVTLIRSANIWRVTARDIVEVR